MQHRTTRTGFWVLLVGFVIFLPGKLLAKELNNACVALCIYSCCGATGLGCNCSCGNDGMGDCWCLIPWRLK